MQEEKIKLLEQHIADLKAMLFDLVNDIEVLFSNKLTAYNEAQHKCKILDKIEKIKNIKR